MIVKCDNCQTRFKIPDEKVTDKGVKVKCTKCQNTFRVTKAGPEAAAAPAAPPPPSAPPSAPAPEFDPFASFGAPGGVPDEDATRPGMFIPGIEASRRDLSSPPSPPPGAASGAGADLDDLFDGPTRVGNLPIPDLARLDPPGPAASKTGAVAAFGARGATPPPGPARALGRIGLKAVPASSVAPPPPAPPPPEVPPPEVPEDGFPGFEDQGAIPTAPPAVPKTRPKSNLLADVPPPTDGFGEDAQSGSFGTAPQDGYSPRSGAYPAADEAGAGAFGSGEDQLTATGPSDVSGLPGSGLSDRGLFDMPPPPPQREYIPAPQEDGPLELAGGSSAPTDAAAMKIPIGAIKLVKPSGKPEDARGLEEGPKQSLGRRISGLALNLSIAGALIFVLLAVALNDGKLDAGAFSAERLKSAFLPSRDLLAADVSNGLYETEHGRPVFYVRGEVVNRSEVAAKVRVRAEILEGSQLVRAAEGLAGVIPTPEELYKVGTQSDLDAISSKRDQGAQAVPPGGRVPFVVAFYEYPPQLAGYRLKVSVASAPPAPAASR